MIRRAVASPSALFGMAATLFIGHRLWLHATVARRITYEDQTLLWTVARDLRQGELHQLDFPGQFYGSSLEALPAALLGGVGMGDALALSLTLLFLQVVPWLGLALVIYRRGQTLLAIVALCAPVVATLDQGAFSIMWATAAGRALAVVGASVALASGRDSIRVGVVAALGGVALLIDTSTALVLVPVAVILVGSVQWSRRALGWLGAGLAAPLAWHLAVVAMRDGNVSYGLHRAPSTSLAFKPVRFHFENPTLVLSDYGPALLDGANALKVVVAVAVIAGVVGAALRFGSLASRLAALALLAGLSVFYSSVGSLRSIEFDAALLPPGRGLMLLPAALLVVAAASVHRPARFQPWHGVAMLMVAAVTVAVSAGRDDPGRFVSDALEDLAVAPRPLTDLDRLCDQIQTEVDAFQPDAVLLADVTATYGCAAGAAAVPPILFPTYERRTWEILAVLETEGTRWLVSEGGSGGCAFMPVTIQCQRSASTSELLLITTEPMTMPDLIGVLGRPLRAKLFLES